MVPRLLIFLVFSPLIDKRLDSDGQLEYFVKWKGYGEEDNTWEPIENFETDAMKAMIVEYEKKQTKVEDGLVIPAVEKLPKSSPEPQYCDMCKVSCAGDLILLFTFYLL